MFSATSGYGKYWWPRRKPLSKGCGNAAARVRNTQRHYSFHGLEQGIPDSPQDMPFIDGFPARLIREGLPGRLNRESVVRENRAASELRSSKIFGNPWAEQLLSQNTEIVIPHNLVDLGENVKEVQKVVTEEQRPVQPSSLVLSVAEPNPSTSHRIPEDEALLKSLPTSDNQLVETIVQAELVDTIETPETGSDESNTTLEKETLVVLDRETSIHTEVNTELQRATRSDKIHILGTGGVSKYIAHSIASLPHAPSVAMLVHRPYLLLDWQQEGAGISLIRHGKISTQPGVELEAVMHFKRAARRNPNLRILDTEELVPQGRIDNLIVATEDHSIIAALLSIKHRIHPSTTICFVDGNLGVSGLGVNSLGLLDVVNSEVFPDPEQRPSYVLANFSHKIASTLNTFTIIEENAGEACFTALDRDAKIPREAMLHEEGPDELERWGPLTHIMKTLTRTPDFAARTLRHSDFLKISLEKMIVQSVIGPLTVMFDCSNEQLLYNYNIQKAFTPLLEECYRVIRVLPGVAPQDIQQFSPHHLQAIIVSILKTTGRNISPMLQAVRKGQKTGIEFYNGFFVRRAEWLGVPCPHNQMMINLVNSKASVIGREREGYIPFKSSHRG
jgi:2-dehydropantoate 2-reductase